MATDKDLEQEVVQEETLNEQEVEQEETLNEQEVEQEVVENVEEEIIFEEDDELIELKEEVETLKDKNTRLQAEFQNYKRRSAEDLLKSKVTVKKDTVLEILDTVDNLERALALVDFEGGKADEFAKGVKMVYDNLMAKLNKLGVTEIDCSGLADHNYHATMAVDNVEELENDQIIEVLQKGYIVDDVVIRHAMVKANAK